MFHKAIARPAAVGMLGLALALSGCVSGSDTSNDESSVSSNLARGGEEDGCTADTSGGSVTVSDQVEYQTLDPAGGSFYLIPAQQIYSTLMRWNPTTEKHEPLLAESLTANEDSTVWTLNLRDGAQFSDGSVLDADAVIASIERHRVDTTQSLFAARARSITSMTAVDSNTVEFKLDAPWVEFPYLLTTGVGMITNPDVDPATLAANPPANAGAGAFVLEKWEPGNELTLAKKDDWWNGVVCLDTVRVIAQSDGKARKDAFDQGEVQVYVGSGDLEVSQAVIDTGANYAKYPLRFGFTPNFGVGSNADTTAGKNPTVRRALQLAINPELMADRLNGGVAEPSTALVSSDSGLAEGLEGLPFDPDEAAALVEEAKADGWDGKLIVASLNQPNNIAIANQAIAQWTAVGIDAQLETLEFSEFLQATILGGGGFDVAVSGGGSQPYPECTSCDLDYFITGGSQNRVGFSDSAIDALAPKFNAAKPEERQALLVEFQDAWNETIPRVIYGQQFYLVAWTPELKGVMPSRILDLDLSKAWLDQ